LPLRESEAPEDRLFYFDSSDVRVAIATAQFTLPEPHCNHELAHYTAISMRLSVLI
jgi:hypothetical protein